MFKAGLNFNPASCCTVKVSPAITGVTPSARRIVPLDGSAVAITVKAAGVCSPDLARCKPPYPFMPSPAFAHSSEVSKVKGSTFRTLQTICHNGAYATSATARRQPRRRYRTLPLLPFEEHTGLMAIGFGRDRVPFPTPAYPRFQIVHVP
jgi:hypothetical protein